MVRLDNFEKSGQGLFDLPSSTRQMEHNCKVRVNNKLEQKRANRRRNNTEIFDAHDNEFSPRNDIEGFRPTKPNHETLTSIQSLRDKCSPKPQLNLSTIFPNNFGKKKVNVVLIKKNEDTQPAAIDFMHKRSRLQTF